MLVRSRRSHHHTGSWLSSTTSMANSSQMSPDSSACRIASIRSSSVTTHGAGHVRIVHGLLKDLSQMRVSL